MEAAAAPVKERMPYRPLYRLLQEVTRRKVIGAMTAYAIAAWIMVQAASVILPAFETPSWVLRTIILSAFAFAPVALLIGWNFDLTPRGFVRTLARDVARNVPARRDLSTLETIGKERTEAVHQGVWADKQPRCTVYPPETPLFALVRDLVGRCLRIGNVATDGERYAVVVDCLDSTADLAGARKAHPGRPVVAVVARPDSAEAMAALSADADGIICLIDPAATWRDCVNVVLGGGRWFGGPGVAVNLDNKAATYEITRGSEQSGDVTVRTRAFVRDLVRDRLQR